MKDSRIHGNHKSSTEKVFVVIVNFKSRRVNDLIKRLSKSKHQIIIVDNSVTKQKYITSSDSGNIKILRNKSNLGFAGGCNIGIKHSLQCGATHVVLLNPDVTLETSQIDQLIRSTGSIVGPVLRYQRNGSTIYDNGGKIQWVLGRTYHLTKRSNQIRDVPGNLDYVSGAAMMVHRAVFEQVGLFDESYFLYFEDVDFCIRAKKAGFNIQINKNIVVDHELSEILGNESKTKSAIIIQSNLKFISKHINTINKPIAYTYIALLTAWINLKLRIRTL